MHRSRYSLQFLFDWILFKFTLNFQTDAINRLWYIAVVGHCALFKFLCFLFSFLKANHVYRLNNQHFCWGSHFLKTKKLFKLHYRICAGTQISNHLFPFELKQETYSCDSLASSHRTKTLMHSQLLYSFYQSISVLRTIIEFWTVVPSIASIPSVSISKN